MVDALARGVPYLCVGRGNGRCPKLDPNHSLAILPNLHSPDLFISSLLAVETKGFGCQLTNINGK